MAIIDGSGNIVSDSTEQAHSGSKAWYTANPNAALLFELSITDLETEIDNLDLTALPTGTANKLKLLLKTLSMTARVLAHREGLV